MDTLTPPLGHNNPPDQIAELVEKLRETHADTINRASALTGMADRLPAECTDEETAAKLADGIKACLAFTKGAEAARVAAKEPYLAAGKAVDGFFKKLADPVDGTKAKMNRLLTDYQRAKADAERRERERIAKEAEERRREEERARREAERAAAEARRQAEEAERKAREEAERAAHEAKTKADREAAAAAAKAAEAEAAAKREEAERLAKDAREAKDKAAVAKEDEAAAKSDATEKAARLTNTRSDLGAHANLRTTWHFEIENPELVPRAYLTVDESAVRVAIRAATTRDGKCPLRIDGIRIYPKTETVVR